MICFGSQLKHTCPLIIRGGFVPLLFLVVYLPSTCFNLVEPVSLLPTVIVYSLWPVRSDTIGGAAIPGPVQQCMGCSGVDYIPRLSRSLIVEGNRAVNTHHHHQPTLYSSCCLGQDLSCRKPLLSAHLNLCRSLSSNVEIPLD